MRLTSHSITTGSRSFLDCIAKETFATRRIVWQTLKETVIVADKDLAINILNF